MEKENKIENRLMVPEKENILIRFFKWVRKIFVKPEKNIWVEEPVIPKIPDITVPTAVKIPVDLENTHQIEDTSLEYLYKLSEDDLDELDKMYDEQMEETKNEVLRLESILQNYKQSIKKLQENLTEDNI